MKLESNNMKSKKNVAWSSSSRQWLFNRCLRIGQGSTRSSIPLALLFEGKRRLTGLISSHENLLMLTEDLFLDKGLQYSDCFGILDDSLAGNSSRAHADLLKSFCPGQVREKKNSIPYLATRPRKSWFGAKGIVPVLILLLRCYKLLNQPKICK